MFNFPIVLSVLLVTAKGLAGQGSLNEQLLGQGLLGAHFGRPGLSATFDYVIAGGGTAGLTMARRLAANPAYTVAVIEAGDFYEFDNGNLSTIPADAAFFVGSDPIFKNPLIDWEQYTVPQAVSTRC